MTEDVMGPKERGWYCAGHVLLEVAGLLAPLVLQSPDDPVVCCLIPLGLDPAWREVAVGWCRCELTEQREGWLGSLRRLTSIGRDARQWAREAGD